MGTGKNRRTALSWLVVAGLFMLCGVLGALQYRWIGEVSVAARDRLRGSLQPSLNRLSLDFNTEIATACRALLPADSGPGSAAAEAEVLVRYAQWKKTARRGQMFRHIALAEPRNKTSVLRILDLDRGVFGTAEWPSGWVPFKERLEDMLSAEGGGRRGFPGPLPRPVRTRRGTFPPFRFEPRVCARCPVAGVATAPSGDGRNAGISGGSLEPAATSGGHLPIRSGSAGGGQRRRFGGPVRHAIRPDLPRFARAGRARPGAGTRRPGKRFGTLADVCAPSRGVAGSRRGGGALA